MTVDSELESWLGEHLTRDGVRLGAGYQAEVWRVATPTGTVAVKLPRGGPMTGWLARAALRAEHQAYSRLTGIPGIPGIRGLTRNGWLVMDYVEGRDLRTEQHSIADREAFYASLLETILAMHAAGVAHGDLKRKDNVIVAADGNPCLIDFGIARIRGRSRIDDLLFDMTRQLDLNAWIKLKHGRQPGELPAADAAIYRPMALERLARWVRIPWQALTLRRPRQRLRRWLAAKRGGQSPENGQ